MADRNDRMTTDQRGTLRAAPLPGTANATSQGDAPAPSDGWQRRTQQGANLTQQDRVRGGLRSAKNQTRDASGQFAGRRDQSSQPPSQAAASNSVGVGRDADTEVASDPSV